MAGHHAWVAGAEASDEVVAFQASTAPRRASTAPNMAGFWTSQKNKVGTMGHLSSASRRYDRAGKGFLTMEEQMMRDLDVDGDGNLSQEELMAAAKRMLAQQNETKKWQKMGFSLIGLLVLLVGVMLGTTIAGNELTKDQRPKEHGEMFTKTGDLVRTGAVESVAKLFDLPYFDSRALAEMRYLTLALKGGDTATFQIASAIKGAGKPYATFLTADGSEIIVDAISMTAVANVHGHSYVVEGTAAARRRRRQLHALETAPVARLYTPQEFFVPAFGFVSTTKDSVHRRRLAPDAETRGWASLSLSAAAAVLDAANANLESGSPPHQSIFVQGAILVPAAGGFARIESRIFLRTANASTGTPGAKVWLREADGDGASTLVDYGQRLVAIYNKHGTLERCAPLSAGQVDGGRGVGGSAEMYDSEAAALAEIGAAVARDKKVVAQEQQHEQPMGYFVVEKYLLDDLGGAIKSPSTEECALIAVRLREAERAAPYSELDHLFVNDGSKPRYVVAFSGTDGLEQLRDWVDNLDARVESVTLPSAQGAKLTMRFHKGFYRHTMMIKSPADYPSMLKTPTLV